MHILGAGLSGCIAAMLNGGAKVIEAAARPEELKFHQALLRFRSDKISRICGIDFEKVTVRKSIFSEGKEFRQSTIKFANWYSKKVTDGYYDRSIIHLDDCDRWIAPDNFHQLLIEQCFSRIDFGQEVIAISDRRIETKEKIYSRHGGDVIVSTIPMFSLLKVIPDIRIPDIKFGINKIHVYRGKVKDCNLHQTVYFPDPILPLYRVSVVRDAIIAESIDRMPVSDIISLVHDSLGIIPSDLMFEESYQQQGKIAPVKDDKLRKEIIHQLSTFHRIYSLGRYGVWRNILLDSVYDDMLQIRRMISKSEYDKTIEKIKENKA